MKQTKVFHTFEYEERKVTLCVTTDSQPIQKTEDFEKIETFMLGEVRIGQSVCMKEDEFKEEIGRTISEGRANKKPMATFLVSNVVITRGLLKQFAKDVEDRLRKGIIEIKGIR